MSCQTPYRDDSAQVLLFKIASCIESGGGVVVAGVSSFNGRTGVVTLTAADVSTALGCTPLCQADGDARYVLKAGDTMTGSLNIANSAILVASDPALDITQTWNNAAVTFTGLNSNITNTASSTNSNLFNFQVDGVDRFNFTPGGSLRAVRQDASDSGMNLFLRKRGNAGGATNALASDATIGTVAYSGWNGAAFVTGSRISGLASEVWTGIANGSRIDLYTTPIGSVTEQIALRLDSTGQAKLLDGTAALPSLTFQSDPDTGIYRIGANSLGISAGGVLRLTVDGTSTTSVGTFLIPDGTAALPGLAFSADTDTGLYRIGANNFGLSAGGALTLAVSTTGINLTTALAYQYNAVNVIRAQTALENYFFGPSGNLTMTGNFNVITGTAAFLFNTTGSRNVAAGYAALQLNTTGSFNVAAGFSALGANTTGSNNSATGYTALSSNTTGSNNSATGYTALFANTTGSSNTAIGPSALTANTTGSFNAALGTSSLSANTTGSNNTAVGYRALFNLSTPATGQNTAVGYNTGLGITTGNNNTILGANVTGLAAALSNNIILADGAGVIRLQIDSSGNTTLAGTVATADGTAALPAYTFSADLDTGIYRVGANHLGVSANGVVVLGVGAAALGFFAAVAAAPVAQQVSGANLTNNVTAGGVNDTIADYADLVIYANDAAAIRNDIYQLARKLKQVNDALRAYGLLT